MTTATKTTTTTMKPKKKTKTLARTTTARAPIYHLSRYSPSPPLAQTFSCQNNVGTKQRSLLFRWALWINRHRTEPNPQKSTSFCVIDSRSPNVSSGWINIIVAGPTRIVAAQPIPIILTTHNSPFVLLEKKERHREVYLRDEWRKCRHALRFCCSNSLPRFRLESAIYCIRLLVSDFNQFWAAIKASIPAAGLLMIRFLVLKSKASSSQRSGISTTSPPSICIG